jgi:hypothetical protein
MKGPLGYGRYRDDPEYVGCPRAKSDMTPCAARDGGAAMLDDATCVGCRVDVADALRDLVREVTKPTDVQLPN